jgi:manganese oxidase
MSRAIVILATGLIASVGAAPRPHRAAAPLSASQRITANDNRRSAGVLRDARLELTLEIRKGVWFPEADAGPSTEMYAFAEAGHSPEAPGPMVRVPEGTTVHITLRNTLSSEEIVVHGLHSRPATTDDVIRIPAGATREASFLAGAPGTYFYWASVGNTPFMERFGRDGLLSGAIIVDPLNALAIRDRVFVIGIYRDELDSAGHERADPREMVVVNGKSWPYTERFTFTQGDTVAWRWINASFAPHPMHMHGFYYNVDRRGREGGDSALTGGTIRQVNTQLMDPGSTMAIHFTPQTPGNWLFHCHLAVHVDGNSNLENILTVRPVSEMQGDTPHSHHGMHDMAGLILGIHVLPRGSGPAIPAREPMRIRLLVQSSPHGYNATRAMGFVLQRGGPPASDSVELPGPVLILERGRPTKITVVNHLEVATGIHWHGLEIESFPDGVPGWSGMPGNLMPPLEAGGSFVAEFTPPRAGTFMYHSHMNEIVQTNSGMYGPIIVTDSAHPFNPAIDKIILVGGGGPGSIESRSPGRVNGMITPQLNLQAGVTYRLRIIQIHPQAVVNFRLGTDSTTARWTPVAKDGADLPAEQSTPRAAAVTMGAGETGEFLYTPERPGRFVLQMNTRGAGWSVPLIIFVKPVAKVAAN